MLKRLDRDCDLLKQAFARAVRDLRHQRRPPRDGKSERFSQELLALEMGMDRSYISALERGGHNPTLCTMYRLSRCLGMTYAQLSNRIQRHFDRAKQDATG